MNENIRNNALYDMQDKFDMLYANSKNGDNFYKLYDLIVSPNNILLAYRNLKSNTGSDTPGLNGTTIEDLATLSPDDMVFLVRNRMQNYKPDAVRRISIPKENGDKRWLGIASIEDRLVQQAVLQVLNPIFEAKFYNHSYGFRTNRNAIHALSRMLSLINVGQYYYCVSIDIKSFFDNVSHEKLKKQLWYHGIRDKRLLSVIGKMLSADVQGIDRCNKGLVQGGILSPLLANIYLDELDKWVVSQWEEFPVDMKYTHNFLNGKAKDTNLKSGYIVRYADDFKIMCRTYDHAIRFYHALVDFLDKRLGLTVNVEKSSIVNLKEQPVEFLGFSIKVVPKGTARYGWIAYTRVCDKALDRIRKESIRRIRAIKRDSHSRTAVSAYNAYVMGVKNYFRYANNVCLDFNKLQLYRVEKNQLKNRGSYTTYSKTGKDFKSQNPGIGQNIKIKTIENVPLHQLTAIRCKNPMNFSQDLCLYTKRGREKMDKKESIYIPNGYISYVLKAQYHVKDKVEFVDNRLSKYLAQKGRCFVTGELVHPKEMSCHHRNPRHKSHDDSFQNLIWIRNDIHILVHSTNSETIDAYLRELKLNGEQMQKVNQLRLLVGNNEISRNSVYDN